MKDTYKVPKSLKKKLQAAVDHLTEHPEKINNSWSNSEVLFRYVHPDLNAVIRPDGEYVGCPTMIKSGRNLAYTDALTEEIRGDKRLPDNQVDITVDHLPIFMEWMLRLAVEFRWKS